MKLYDRSRFNVLFLLPLAAVATGDGCSSTAETVIPPTEVIQLLSGNTLSIVDEEIYAFTRADGTMAGKNTKTGGTVGKWWMTDSGELCGDWQDDKEAVACDKLKIAKDKTYLWLDTKLQIAKGNTQNL